MSVSGFSLISRSTRTPISLPFKSLYTSSGSRRYLMGTPNKKEAPQPIKSIKSDSSSVYKSEQHLRSTPSEVDNDIADKAGIRDAVLKMDMSLLPIISMFYLLSFLDRTNIGNARVAGLQKDLRMTDRQYQIAITTTYIPYIVSEVPATLLLRKIGPKYFLPSILTVWGFIVIAEGFVTSFRGLIVARAFLGFVEGPMFPGIVLYLSSFYTREELSLRIAFFFSAASLAGAFSGLLSAAIVNMHGVRGKPGWAWIFILEGIFSVVISFLSFFLVPPTPNESKFLSKEQKRLITRRLEQDRPVANPLDVFNVKNIFYSIRSPQVIILIFIFFLNGTNMFGLALFLPSIVHQLGYDPNHTQLLSVGPFAIGFVVTLLTAHYSDKYKRRALPIVIVSILAVIGFSISLASTNKHMSYGALFIIVPGVYGIAPITAAWVSNNSEPYYRRATSIAIGLSIANFGGIFSTWRYPSKEGPKFHNTTIINLTFAILVMVLAGVNYFYLSWMNKQKIVKRNEILAPFTSTKDSDGDMRAWVELGDRHPDFHYVL